MVSNLSEARSVMSEQIIPVEDAQPGHLHVTWEAYGETSKRLAVKIRDSEWQFDHILCIARGGMFIGDTLSRLFQKPIAITSTSSYREDNGTQQSHLIISKHIAMTAEMLGKHVLLVDDLVDSGATLDELKKVLHKKYPHVVEIRTAVLWFKTRSTFMPDYYADTVDGGTWIHQPFEVYDGVSLADL